MRLSRDLRVGLSRHADLKSRPDGDVLVLPERALRVGGSGGEILRVCEDEGAVGTIVETLRQRYPDSAGVEEQVISFIQEMIELGGLVELDIAREGGGP